MTYEQQKEYEENNRLDEKRREPGEYCMVRVLKGYFPDSLFNGGKKWYWMLEGEEVFCRIKRGYRDNIEEYYPCYLTNTKIKIGRGIDAQDCVII